MARGNGDIEGVINDKWLAKARELDALSQLPKEWPDLLEASEIEKAGQWEQSLRNDPKGFYDAVKAHEKCKAELEAKQEDEGKPKLGLSEDEREDAEEFWASVAPNAFPEREEESEAKKLSEDAEARGWAIYQELYPDCDSGP